METVRLIECDPLDQAALHCLSQYYAELDARFEGGFRVERSSDPDADLLRRPKGSFIIALAGDEPVGCAALKGTCPAYGEVKRMWIAPEARGSGLAAALIERVETIARELGMVLLRLDTNRALPQAVAIYRHWGWREIERFNEDPYADFFFEKPL